MELAIGLAAEAGKSGEVPVGAVVVKDGAVVATGQNRTIGWNDPSAHAEVVALREAARVLGTHRMNGLQLFVTLEPCAMCSGAIFHSRLARVVFGAADPKTGCAGSVLDLFASRQLNHHTEVKGDVLAEQCAALLQDFFVQSRRRKNANAAPLRDDALRTPLSSVQGLNEVALPGAYHYGSEGLRMHCLELGSAQATQSILCIHDFPYWSYQFAAWLPALISSNYKLILPDLLGCGLSDKPKKPSWHHLDAHVRALQDLPMLAQSQPSYILALGTGLSIAQTLVKTAGWTDTRIINCQPAPVVPEALDQRRKRKAQNTPLTLSMKAKDYFVGLERLNRKAMEAPFPDNGYAAVLRGMQHSSFKAVDADAAVDIRLETTGKGRYVLNAAAVVAVLSLLKP